ncbi:MAG TPA: ABC transporter ATP-binding protein [Limnochordia bacterium]
MIVEGLTKRYGDVVAVDGVSFSVREGEIFGLLGPNGAGKTTTLEMLEGLRRPDGGRAIVAGVDVAAHPREVRRRIGVQLQEAGFFEKLTVAETLSLFASFHPRHVPIDELIEAFQLGEKRRARIESLSGGQKQRLSLALTVLNDPRLVFLDEPTTGLDPQARHNLWDVIQKMREAGRTVVLTTHYMEEAERLCDRVAIIDRGRIVALDTPERLINEHAGGARVILGGWRTDDGVAAGDVGEWLGLLPGVKRAEAAGDTWVLLSDDPAVSLPALFERAQACSGRFSQIAVEAGSLEDVFLNLTGKRLRE